MIVDRIFLGKSSFKPKVAILSRVVIPNPTLAGADSNLIQKENQLTNTQKAEGLNLFVIKIKKIDSTSTQSFQS